MIDDAVFQPSFFYTYMFSYIIKFKFENIQVLTRFFFNNYLPNFSNLF